MAKLKGKFLELASVAGDKLADNIALRGAPTAPTAEAGTKTGQVATTQFVDTAVQAAVGIEEAARIAADSGLSTQIANLTTDNVAEGSRLYFTSARAKAAAVADQISGLVTDVAPSQAAVSKALEAQNFYHELHVNFDYTGGSSDGSPWKPFTSIQAAVTAAIAQNTGASTVIKIHNPKNAVITENVVVNNAVANLMLEAIGVKDGHLVRINGSLTLSGTTVRFRAKGLQFNTASGTPTLTINGTQGRHIFEKCSFAGGGGVSLTGSYANWITFQDCSIEGPTSIAGTPAANTLISFYGLFGAFTALTVNAANAIVSMYETYSIGSITHTAGTLSLNRFGGIVGTFDSTASAGALFLSNGSLQKSDTTFAALNKTGSCIYQLVNVHRGETSDVLTGTRIAFGPTASDAGYKMGVSGNWPSAVYSVGAALDSLAANKATTSYVTSAVASEASAREAADTAKLAEAKSYADSKVATEASARESADTANLAEAKAYTDAEITDAITGLIPATEKGSANGVAPLDGSGKIASSYLPSSILGAIIYQGTWDASTAAYPTSPSKGQYWVISVAGTISGHEYAVGDWIVYDGSAWGYVDNQSAVSSVNGKVGAVSLTTTDIAEGTNKYFTDAAAKAAAVANALNAGVTDVAPSQAAVVTALAAKQNTLAPTKDKIQMTSGILAAGFFDLSVKAIANTIVLYPIGGCVQEEGVDYTVQLTGGTGGVTKITMSADLISMLTVADALIVQYIA